MGMGPPARFLNPELWTVELSPVPMKKRADSAKNVPQIHVAVLFQKKILYCHSCNTVLQKFC